MPGEVVIETLRIGGYSVDGPIVLRADGGVQLPSDSLPREVVDALVASFDGFARARSGRAK